MPTRMLHGRDGRKLGRREPRCSRKAPGPNMYLKAGVFKVEEQLRALCMGGVEREGLETLRRVKGVGRSRPTPYSREGDHHKAMDLLNAVTGSVITNSVTGANFLFILRQLHSHELHVLPVVSMGVDGMRMAYIEMNI